LVSIDLRDVTALGVACFEDCTALRTIVPPRNATAFPARVFKNCRLLQRVVLPPVMNALGAEAFAGSRLIEVDLGHVTTLGESCFDGCSELQRCALSSGLRTISKRSLAGCGALREITIPDGVETVEQAAFYQAGLERVVLPPSLRAIRASAFAGTKLKEIDVPDSLTRMGERAFDCPLTKVSLGQVSDRWWRPGCFGTVRRIEVECRGGDVESIPRPLMEVVTGVRAGRPTPLNEGRKKHSARWR
jgi:hypothetical protein